MNKYFKNPTLKQLKTPRICIVIILLEYGHDNPILHRNYKFVIHVTISKVRMALQLCHNCFEI